MSNMSKISLKNIFPFPEISLSTFFKKEMCKKQEKKYRKEIPKRRHLKNWTFHTLNLDEKSYPPTVYSPSQPENTVCQNWNELIYSPSRSFHVRVILIFYNIPRFTESRIICRHYNLRSHNWVNCQI